MDLVSCRQLVGVDRTCFRARPEKRLAQIRIAYGFELIHLLSPM
jgi:hypothetical protein